MCFWNSEGEVKKSMHSENYGKRVKAGLLMAMIGLVCAGTLLPARGVVADRSVAGKEPEEVIVRLEDGEDEDEFDDDYDECEIEETLDDFQAYRVRMTGGQSAAQFVTTVVSDPRVKY